MFHVTFIKILFFFAKFYKPFSDFVITKNICGFFSKGKFDKENRRLSLYGQRNIAGKNQEICIQPKKYQKRGDERAHSSRKNRFYR